MDDASVALLAILFGISIIGTAIVAVRHGWVDDKEPEDGPVSVNVDADAM